MTTKNIFAIGRISKGTVEIQVAPTLENRAIASARWFGALDAENGASCLPTKYFSQPEMIASYCAGYAEVVGSTPTTEKYLKGK